jgi:hypothetical protein
MAAAAPPAPRTCSKQAGGAPRPSPSAAFDTIAASEVGSRLVVTASVVAAPPGRAFVVRDADMPEQGLLVLGQTDVAASGLVTVEGTVDLFRFEVFSDRYELTDPAPYRRFEGRKVLVADTVRS